MTNFSTGIDNFSIRYAGPEDFRIIYDFIKKISVYEKMESDMVATPEDIRSSLFDKKQAEVLLGFYGEKPVGYAIYFYSYSTFLGRSTMYLEDIFVDSDMRGKGFGKAMLKAVAQVAVENDCRRMDWSCLNWNRSSIDFYLSLGAKPMSEWTIYRLEGETLNRVAES